MTPEEVCALLPQAERSDCIAAGELLSAPRDRAPEADLTLRLTADGGRLSAAYDPDCPTGDMILLPADEDVSLLFTSRDAVYRFDAPGLVAPIHLVPGRVDERLVRTPPTPGPIAGELRADGDDAARPVVLHVVSAGDPMDRGVICAGEPSE